MTNDVDILDGVRTAIGTLGGSLAKIAPTTLAAAVAKEAISRRSVDPKQIGHAIFGHVINTEGRDMYLGRVAAVEAGVPAEAPALTVNRLCGPGAQAIVSSAQHIMLGDIGSRSPVVPNVCRVRRTPGSHRVSARRWAMSA